MSNNKHSWFTVSSANGVLIATGYILNGQSFVKMKDGRFAGETLCGGADLARALIS